jgi:hypothetical protein
MLHGKASECYNDLRSLLYGFGEEPKLD